MASPVRGIFSCFAEETFRGAYPSVKKTTMRNVLDTNSRHIELREPQ